MLPQASLSRLQLLLQQSPAGQALPQACTALQSLRQLHASGAAAADPPGPLDRFYDQQQPPRPAVLYPTHVPLHPVQKGAVAALSALGALVRPARADLVHLVGETLGDAAVRRLRDRMASSPSGRTLLAQRPRVTDAAVAHCWDLPPTTFGGAYAAFMGERGFRADDRPTVRLVDDEELAYVIVRAREVHDFWHTLFGCHTNVFGELALKALEFVQTGLPMTAMAVAGAQFKLSPADRALLWRVYMPWAAQAGLRCADLITLHYEAHFEDDLEELRGRWRIRPAPPVPEHLAFRQQQQGRQQQGQQQQQEEEQQP